MNFIYVGQYSSGTTSKMRADIIIDLVNPRKTEIIDVNIPFYKTHRIWRSIGFRLKKGPLITRINKYLLEKINALEENVTYDLIWVDKGIFLEQEIVKRLKKISANLIHFTPDMAFYANKSDYFYHSINLYDFLVTTKSTEIDCYLKYIDANKLLVTTQGYSKQVHYPMHNFEEKDGTVAFVGLAEPHRIKVVEALIRSEIYVKIAGKGWDSFCKKYKNNKFLKFHGKGLFSEEYTDFYSSASFGLGLLSKNFPELHTTRTFEIPACGTALLTENNIETINFFDHSSAIFYNNTHDLVNKIKFYNDNQRELMELSNKGFKQVTENGYDYNSILSKILQNVK